MPTLQLTVYGMGAYEAFRQNHRPDLPDGDKLHQAVEWLRRNHIGTAAAAVGKQAVSRQVRRRVLNTRQERELRDILYPTEQ